MAVVRVGCPECGRDRVVKRGRTPLGKQRYLCMNPECAKKTFILYYSCSRRLPLTILNQRGDYLPQVETGTVDLVCMDPPYYDNVLYAELSDFGSVIHVVKASLPLNSGSISQQLR